MSCLMEDIVSTYDLDFKIVDMEIVGSRARGTAMPGSDLDVVVQYTGGLKEDAAFNIFNEERLKLDNIQVDINPIEEPLNKWLERNKEYMKKTVYIAGRPEAVKENGTRIAELETVLREAGYAVTGRAAKEPWQMSKAEFLKTAVPLPDRKDFLKAWLKDNENIPNFVNPKINYIPMRGYASLVFGNEKGQAVGVVTFAKGAIQHIAVSDKYKNKGIATQLLEESRKYGVRSIAGPVSPEFASIAHRFAVKQAFLEGKPVPPGVLGEYPDLATKAEKEKWRRTV